MERNLDPPQRHGFVKDDPDLLFTLFSRSPSRSVFRTKYGFNRELRVFRCHLDGRDLFEIKASVVQVIAGGGAVRTYYSLTHSSIVTLIRGIVQCPIKGDSNVWQLNMKKPYRQLSANPV